MLKKYIKKFRRSLFFEILNFFFRYRFKRKKLDGKLVFITGIAGGLGRGLALHFARNNYRVAGLDMKPESSLDDTLKQAIEKFYQFDLRNLDQIDAFVEEVYNDFQSIDILINNAGILNFKMLTDYSNDEIIDMIHVKLTAAILLVKNLLPRMQGNKFGRIINISSTSAHKGEDKFGVYSPVNSGLIMFTDSIARLINNKMEGDLTINSIKPHRIATPEYLEENPDIKESSLISISRVFKRIDKVITSEVNGGHFPVFSFGLKLEYYFRTVHKLFFS